MEEAIRYYQQALEIAREVGDRRGEAIDLFNLGDEYVKLDKVAEGLECLRQALAIFEEIKSPYAERARRRLKELEAAHKARG